MAKTKKMAFGGTSATPVPPRVPGGLGRMTSTAVNPGASTATGAISSGSSQTGGASSPGPSVFRRRAPDLAPRPVPRAMSTAGRAMNLPAGAKEDADTSRDRGRIGILPMRPMKPMAKGGMTSSASKRADGIAAKGKTRGKMC